MQAKLSLLTVAALALAGFAPAAHAYLDPSTGSMILSAIVGVIATVGLAVKTYWYKLKSLVRGGKAAQVEGAAERQATEDRDSDTHGS